uniref:HEAT repeat-containing protein n=1 Tax=Candidatus Kentrum sp. MB TaxID=2138164 RepID=A0A450XNK4_9GAMM|nr:MAG: HEAT repeat-containing protein [Candidatus Kentron sp. MB]VFK34515.1 MAG: HEAT repeat-containing protein [Candidatus Kentron sp. MB]VFK76795.1 MAG: HEAT repeat-containing protein [Candidatus Kentron sp. MB]
MKTKILIAHAEGETDQAQLLADPLAKHGYEPVHHDTILVGESLVEEAGKLLHANAPLVLCGTTNAIGTGFCRRLVNAARARIGPVRIFPVRMKENADLEALSFDARVAEYWQDPHRAIQELTAAIEYYYPPNIDARHRIQQHELESRYRELLFKACDIIDLANLPEDNRFIATRDLTLRRLYVALRLRLDARAEDADNDKALAELATRHNQGRGAGGDREGVPGQSDQQTLVSLGERLHGVQPHDPKGAASALVVLGDPGAGKSTLLRWLAIACLLRLKEDPAFADLPDVASLPRPQGAPGWLPILVRCRALPPDTDTLDAMLLHTLRKGLLPEADCAPLVELLRIKLEKGVALLLVDGLDEITDPAARARFSQQLARIHHAFPRAPMVVTSRIVGYREMGYRIRAGFEHLTVADFSPEDKDEFARRWCTLTERPERQESAAFDLIRDIHSAERIERLTGNPMLLTTMALIKRKIGRLPQRRVDLYEEAIKVLLNWRSEVDQPLDAREALPQLEYLAHAMCKDGVQQLREDQILDLLRAARVAYPNLHALARHTPEEFLARLETRTGLLIRNSHICYRGHNIPMYEFRYLTFQEYLAGLSLIQGHYRGEEGSTLAQAIARLAKQVREVAIQFSLRKEKEIVVMENWREALRLAVSACNDNQTEAILSAILRPLPEERGIARPRAVLAGLCLADEPDVSKKLALEILQRLATQVEEQDSTGGTSLVFAAMELARSRWKALLQDSLLREFIQRSPGKREHPGRLYGKVEAVHIPAVEEPELPHWLFGQIRRLMISEREATGFALTLMELASHGQDCRVSDVIDGLIQWLPTAKAALSHAATWALYWLNHEQHGERVWRPNPDQQAQLVTAATRPDFDSEALRYLSGIFRNERIVEAVAPLLVHLSGNQPTGTRDAIIEALGAIGDVRACSPLMARLRDRQERPDVRAGTALVLARIDVPEAREALYDTLRDPDEEIRQAALEGLAQECEEMDQELLSRDLDGVGPWLDPRQPIDSARMEQAAQKLDKPLTEIRRRYRALAERFGLTLAE